MSFVFSGFSSPNYTQFPDEALDLLMPQLSGGEWKVLCYVIRRSLGFKKTSDDISLKQMVEGIQTRDGRRLDGGTGLPKSSVALALKSLVEQGILVAHRNQSSERGNEPTTYALHFRDTLVQPADKGGPAIGQALVQPPDTQETVDQETDLQETGASKSSNDPPAWLQNLADETSASLDDQSHHRSNRTRLRAFYERSGANENAFRLTVSQALNDTLPRRQTLRNPMGYFFKLLEEKLTKRTTAGATGSLAGRYSHLVHRAPEE